MADLYLFDTCIAPAPWDKNHRHHEKARTLVCEVGESNIAVSVVTLAEVECGLKSNPQMDEERKSIVRAQMAQYVYVVDISKHTVDSYSEIKSRLIDEYAPADSRGKPKKKWVEDFRDEITGKLLGVQENDIWIAAQAYERNASLVTEDRMDRIVNLTLNPPLRIVRLSDIQ